MASTIVDPHADRRERLTKLRDQLESAIAVAEANMLPQLAGQYRATLADLAALPPVMGKVSVTDDLKARRESRRAASKAQASTRRGKVERRG